MALARNPIVFSIAGLNLKTVASTVIVPAVSGRTFIITDCWVKFVTVTSITVGPTVSVLAFSDTVTEYPAQVLSSYAGGAGAIHILAPTSMKTTSANLSSGLTVNVSVTVGATGTACTGDVYLRGVMV